MRYFLRLVSRVFLAAAVCSCSVKEDRQDCPCILTVSLSGDDGCFSEEPVGLLLGSGGAGVLDESLPRESFDPEYRRAVRRGRLSLSLWDGASGMERSGSTLAVPRGEECDSLYSYHGLVDATLDEAHADAYLHKQFCTVTVSLESGRALDGFRFLVEGSYCGLDLRGAKPVPGPFSCGRDAAAGETSVSVRVPRQGDDSLRLTLWYTAAYSLIEQSSVAVIDYAEEGLVPCGTFPIGEYIREMGYDWTEDSLRDVSLRLDRTLNSVVISIDGWEEGAAFPFIEQ